MSCKTCCVSNCFVKFGDGIPLHQFPNPDSEPGLFADWVTNIGGEITTLDENFVYRNRRICHKHFDIICYGSKNRLIKNAVPSLDLPGVILEQDNMQMVSFVGSSPVASTSYMPATARGCSIHSSAVKVKQSARKTMRDDAMKHISAKMTKRTKTFLEVKGGGEKAKGRHFFI